MPGNSSARISSISPRYKRLYNKYYKQLAQQRHAELLRAIDNFYRKIIVQKFDFDWNFRFCVNEARLKHAVFSYFIDVIRYKEFHFSPDLDKDEESVHADSSLGGKYVDINKQAAYMIKWLLKAKPISIELSVTADRSRLVITPEQSELMIIINEAFALIFSAAILNIPAKAIADADKERLIYQLHFRIYEEGAYVELFSLLSRTSGNAV